MGDVPVSDPRTVVCFINGQLDVPNSTGAVLDLAKAPSSKPSGGKPRVRPDARTVVLCDDSGVACTVLIVDDHAGFRSFARGLLQGEGFDVVGEVADGDSAVVAAAALRPQLVLLDVQLPDFDGFEVARRLAEWPSGPAVVLISNRDASSYRRRLADTPARGFISKSELSAAALVPLVG